MDKRKYSVFLTKVASYSDRYCAAYGPEFTMEEIFDRVKSIPLLDAVDIVMTQNHITQKDRLRENLSRTGLKVASVAVDTFANPYYQHYWQCPSDVPDLRPSKSRYCS